MESCLNVHPAREYLNNAICRTEEEYANKIKWTLQNYLQKILHLMMIIK